MKKEYQIVFKLLDSAINQKSIGFDDILTDDEWKEITSLLAKNGLLGVAYDAIEYIPKEKRPSQAIIDGWKNYGISYGMRQLLQKHNVDIVLNEAEKENIKLVVIKGRSLALLYPKPNMRISCDSDIYVSPENKEKTIEILERNGYVYQEKGSKDNVPVYVKENGGKIELHNRLWEDYESELIDTLDSFDLVNEQKYIKIKDGKNEFYTLGYEEHLIFQIFHVAKHFSLEGVGLKYICDLTLYVNKYKDNIDWNIFWNKMEILHYEFFCDALFKIAVMYMGMDNSVLIEKYEKNVVEDELIEDIINIGRKEDVDIGSWKIMGKLMPYFLQERKVPATKWEKFRSKFCPTQEDISDYYQYAKKYKCLLPVAWVHRFFHATKYEKSLETVYTKEQKEVRDKRLEDRMRLMEKVGFGDRKV